MKITFVPRRGAILMCDFGPETWTAPRPTTRGPIGVRPEMPKKRRCVVVSPEAYNQRDRAGFGLCVVVPLSATPPATVNIDPTAVAIPAGRYDAITANVWAKCTMVMSVSHERLSRPQVRGRYVAEWFTRADMALVEAALLASLGL